MATLPPLCSFFFRKRVWSFEHHKDMSYSNLLHCSHISIQPFFSWVCYGRKWSASVTGRHKICMPSVEKKIIYRAYQKSEERRPFMILLKITLQWGLEFLCYSKTGTGSCPWILEDVPTRALKIKYFCLPVGQLHYQYNLVTQTF